MLVLGCREGEKIGVGDLTVTFLGYQGGGIRLGFDGPREVPVVRANARKRIEQAMADALLCEIEDQLDQKENQ